MNREEAKALLPIIQAFADGKTIQFKYSKHDAAWNDCDDAGFRLSFENGVESYRIRPEPSEWYEVNFDKMLNRAECIDLVYRYESIEEAKRCVPANRHHLIIKVREVIE